MSAPQAFLAAWAELSAELGRLVDLALELEPAGGTSDAWEATLAKLGVEPLGEDARYAAARAQKQTRGAPLEEVGACLRRVAERGQGLLAPLLADLDEAQRARVGSGLGLLLEESERRYREAACARKKGMFAHAREAAQQHPYRDLKAVHGYVLRCPACRAPRLQPDLACVFCGARF